MAVNLDNGQDNFEPGQVDIFGGVALGECYQFELGTITDISNFGKFFVGKILESDNRIQKQFQAHFNFATFIFYRINRLPYID